MTTSRALAGATGFALVTVLWFVGSSNQPQVVRPETQPEPTEPALPVDSLDTGPEVTPSEPLQASVDGVPAPAPAETEDERRARITAQVLAALEACPEMPPESPDVLAELLAALFSPDIGLEPRDLPWLTEDFIARIVSIEGDEWEWGDSETQALVAVRILLGVVFQNHENGAFQEWVGASVREHLVATVLETFDVLHEDARSFLARALMEDGMLVGEEPAVMLRRLLELDPVPPSVARMLESYAESDAGAEFLQELGREYELGELPDDADVIAAALEARLTTLGHPELARQYLEDGTTPEEQRGVLKAISGLGEYEMVMALARSRLSGDFSHAPHLHEFDFRHALRGMVLDGQFPREAVREAIARDDGTLTPALVNTLLEPEDAPLLRWVAGIAPVAGEERPATWGSGPAPERFRAMAIVRLAQTLEYHGLESRDFAALESGLHGRDPRALRELSYIAAKIVERLGPDDPRGTRLQRELDDVGDAPGMAEELREAIAMGLADWERRRTRRRSDILGSQQ